MRVLIIDDSIDKISNLTEVINTLPFKCFIDNTETITNAIIILKEKKYDIVIFDLHLPLRIGDVPDPKGGKFLLEEIYRKNKSLNIPKYIIGFSQYAELNDDFSPIWKVIRYEPSKLEWQNSIISLFNHVAYNLVDKDQNLDEILPTVIVEGLTDLDFINAALELFFPQFKNKLSIKSQSNAGANWVGNQVIIWSLQNFKDGNDKNLICVGLLDSDEAGNLAKKVINEKLTTQNEQNSFKIVQILPKYNNELLKFYSVKCKIELEIESLFPIEIFEYAESKNWLEYRNQTFISNPTDWEQHHQTTSQYIISKGIEEKNLLYTKKVKMSKKIAFSNYVMNLEDKKNTFKNFEPLIKEIIKSLKINE